MAAGDTPFIIQLAEALSALSIPLGGGLAAYAKWRKTAERDRRAREEAARIAAEKASSDARKDEQAMRDRLLAEKDLTINRLQGELSAARADNDDMHRRIEDLLRGGKGDGDDRK